MSTNLYKLKSLQRNLQDLLDGGTPRYRRLGVCAAALCIEDYVDFSKWEHFSGNKTYPIPHATLSAEKAWYRTENLWDKRTTYGKLRWEFVEWCLGQINAEIVKIKQENEK